MSLNTRLSALEARSGPVDRIEVLIPSLLRAIANGDTAARKDIERRLDLLVDGPPDPAMDILRLRARAHGIEVS